MSSSAAGIPPLNRTGPPTVRAGSAGAIQGENPARNTESTAPGAGVSSPNLCGPHAVGLVCIRRALSPLQRQTKEDRR